MKKMQFPANATKNFNHSIDDLEHQYNLSVELANVLARVLTPPLRIGVIHGAERTGVVDNMDGTWTHTIGEGLLVYEGEVYKMTEQEVTSSSADAVDSVYFHVAESDAANEPRKLSDNTDFAVRREKVFSITSSASGAISKYGEEIDLRCTDWVDLTLESGWKFGASGLLKWRKRLGMMEVIGQVRKDGSGSNHIIAYHDLISGKNSAVIFGSAIVQVGSVNYTAALSAVSLTLQDPTTVSGIADDALINFFISAPLVNFISFE
jgi:hypothetical protein